MSLQAYASLPAGTLSSLQTSYIAALTALASNKSYSLNGRMITRADERWVTDQLAIINAAIQLVNGSTATQTYVSFTGR